MTRLEKCRILKLKGYSYDPETGKIYGIRGKELKAKDKDGYIMINSNYTKTNLRGHHFAWHMVYGNVDFIELDHENQIKTDNRICNLRNITHRQNMYNINKKGYSFDKKNNKWQSLIRINGKQTFLGRFNTEIEARNAYLEAKKKYHII